MVKKKISFYDFETRRVTADRNFLVERSNEKKSQKTILNYSTMKTIRKMHDWSIFMIAWTSLLRLTLQKS